MDNLKTVGKIKGNEIHELYYQIYVVSSYTMISYFKVLLEQSYGLLKPDFDMLLYSIIELIA